jgi:CDP-glucose 4,6-dehydratase
VKVLVTGGSGFVGGHVLRRLAGSHDVVTTARDFKNPYALDHSTVVAQGDLRDSHFAERVVIEYEPDAVVHTAASAIVRQGQLDPHEMYTSNVIGTLNLLEACRKQGGVKNFLHLSTDKVLGDGLGSLEDKPYPYADLGPYEQSKVMQEILALRYRKFFGVTILRSCNIYGPEDVHNRIIPNTIRQCLDGEDPVVFKEDPPSKRQYIYVSDVVDAIEMLVGTGVKPLSETFHIGTPYVLTQAEVVEQVIKATDPQLKPRFIKDEATRKQFLWYINQQSLDYHKIREWFGWEPAVTFDEGIRQTVEWWTSGNVKG